MKEKHSSIAILFALFLLCALTACGNGAQGDGKNQEKTETQISDDVQARDDYFSSCGLKVNSFSISKRQTNVEDKNDFVWCAVTASNNDFSYSAEYKVTYVLYNDGWLLEEYTKESSSIKPLHYPTADQVEPLIREYYYNDGGTSKDLQVNVYAPTQTDTTVTYPCRVKFLDSPIHLYSDYALIFQFDPQSGWTSEVNSNVNLWF